MVKSGNIVIRHPYAYDDRMKLDDVWMILQLDMHMWSRLHHQVFLVNTPHEHSNTAAPWLSQTPELQARVILYHGCCTAVLPLRPLQCVILWLRGCF